MKNKRKTMVKNQVLIQNLIKFFLIAIFFCSCSTISYKGTVASLGSWKMDVEVEVQGQDICYLYDSKIAPQYIDIDIVNDTNVSEGKYKGRIVYDRKIAMCFIYIDQISGDILPRNFNFLGEYNGY